MMTGTAFKILKYETSDAQTFLEFWNRQYNFGREHLYDENIGKPITPKSLLALFDWKNGHKLSANKQKSIQQYLRPDERIEADADPAALRRFLCRPGGAIWRIYWLHIQHPYRFPIYDQHVHRAMAVLSGWAEIEIPTNNTEKVDTYIGRYLSFVGSFALMPIRTVDRALWAYGRFLSFEYTPLTAT